MSDTVDGTGANPDETTDVVGTGENPEDPHAGEHMTIIEHRDTIPVQVTVPTTVEMKEGSVQVTVPITMGKIEVHQHVMWATRFLLALAIEGALLAIFDFIRLLTQ